MYSEALRQLKEEKPGQVGPSARRGRQRKLSREEMKRFYEARGFTVTSRAESPAAETDTNGKAAHED
jgi:hypothetical protein